MLRFVPLNTESQYIFVLVTVYLRSYLYSEMLSEDISLTTGTSLMTRICAAKPEVSERLTLSVSDIRGVDLCRLD